MKISVGKEKIVITLFFLVFLVLCYCLGTGKTGSFDAYQVHDALHSTLYLP